MARPTGRPVRDELIDGAQRLIQQVGVNGFSYGILAKQLDIKSPSIHHHFRTKEDLVAEVAERYRHSFADRVHAITAPNAAGRIREYAALFAATADEDLLCLCGAVAADWSAVGDKPRDQVEGFFDDQTRWLKDQLQAGAKSGEFSSVLNVDAAATTLLSALEGVMFLSRAHADPQLVSTVVDQLLDLITSHPNP